MESLYYRFLNHYQGSYTSKVLTEAIQLLFDLWPYLLAGIAITTLIKLYLPGNRLSGILMAKRNLSIPLASLLGVISPLGSYVLIPLSAALFRTGIPFPVLMALLVSSPLIDPNLFILTNGALGIEMAVARLIAAFLIGILAGYVTAFLMDRKWFIPALSGKKEPGDRWLAPTDVKPDLKTFGKSFFKMTLYIGKFFLLAILLAAAIKIFTPPNLMLRIFRDNTFLSILFSTSAGIPFYVCGGAAIPVVMELANLGLSKGAILAFFISGPVTKLSNLVLIAALYKKNVLVSYITIGIAGAILAGLLFQWLG